MIAIQGIISNSLSKWLMQRTQHVVLDGFSSDPTTSKMFYKDPIMLYFIAVNDINVGISLSLRQFVYICVLLSNGESLMPCAEQV